MAVAFDAGSFSSSASVSQASFTLSHTPVGTPKGVIVYVFTGGTSTNKVTSVTYGSLTLSLVDSAIDSAGEPGRVDVFFGGASIPTGAQTVTVTRTNDTTSMVAGCVTVTASRDTQLAGGVKYEGDRAGQNPSVDDGSVSGANSLRVAGAYGGMASVNATTGGTTTLAPGTGSTNVGSFDWGNYVCQMVRETTAGTGSRSCGFYATNSDDWASLHYAIRERTAGGTLAKTEAADTLAGTAQLYMRGTLAVTEGADVTTSGTRAAGQVYVRGSLAQTEGADTAGGTGKVYVQGSLAKTEGADTLSATGTVVAAATEASAAISASASILAVGGVAQWGTYPTFDIDVFDDIFQIEDIKPATAALTGTGTVAGARGAIRDDAAVLSGAGSVVCDGRRFAPADAALTASASVSLSSAGAERPRAGAISTSASIAGVAERVANVSAALSAGGASVFIAANTSDPDAVVFDPDVFDLDVFQIVIATYEADGALAAAASVAADRGAVRAAAAALVGGAGTVEVGGGVRPRSGALEAAGSIVAVAVAERPASASLTASASILAGTVKSAPAAFAAAATLEAGRSVIRGGVAVLSAAGQATSGYGADRAAAAALSAGVSQLSVGGAVRPRSATLAAAGSVEAHFTAPARAALDAAATQTVDATRTRECTASLTASGSVSCATFVERVIGGSLTAAATVFCEVSVSGTSYRSAALTAQADLDSEASATRDGLAALAGAASVSGAYSVTRRPTAALAAAGSVVSVAIRLGDVTALAAASAALAVEVGAERAKHAALVDQGHLAVEVIGLFERSAVLEAQAFAIAQMEKKADAAISASASLSATAEWRHYVDVACAIVARAGVAVCRATKFRPRLTGEPIRVSVPIDMTYRPPVYQEPTVERGIHLRSVIDIPSREVTSP